MRSRRRVGLVRCQPCPWPMWCDVSRVAGPSWRRDPVAEVRDADGTRQGVHYWNRLSGGLEVDLTRSQFTRGERIGEPEPAFRPANSEEGRLAEQYALLADRVARRVRIPAGAQAPLAATIADFSSTRYSPEAGRRPLPLRADLDNAADGADRTSQRQTRLLLCADSTAATALRLQA
jgi:hypothetical protein